jgi:hypothetical protein
VPGLGAGQQKKKYFFNIYFKNFKQHPTLTHATSSTLALGEVKEGLPIKLKKKIDAP